MLITRADRVQVLSEEFPSVDDVMASVEMSLEGGEPLDLPERENHTDDVTKLLFRV